MNIESYADLLIKKNYLSKALLFKSMNKMMEAVSKDTLEHILDYAKDTEIGKKYGFSHIKTIEDFRRQIPITSYDDYEPYIERLKNGESNVLFPGKTISFADTSGTTGKDKLLPNSEFGSQILLEVLLLRMIELVRSFHSVLGGDTNEKMFVITNPEVTGYTEAGIPYGAISGQTSMLIKDGKKLSRTKQRENALKSCRNLSLDSYNYVLLLFGIASKNVRMLCCNNVSHFALLMQLLNNRKDDLINDLEKGTISTELGADKEKLMKYAVKYPVRACELKSLASQKGELLVEDIWKKFHVVNCWYSASVGRAATENVKLFPADVIFWDAGYGASEGKFNIPLRKNDSYGVPANFGYFFEYVPLDENENSGQPLLINETVDGNYYRLIVTSYSGLYRYDMRDIVCVKSSQKGTKMISFAGKEKDKITISGHTLYAMTFIDYLQEYEQQNNCFIKVFKGHEESGALLLDIECHDDSFCMEDFKVFLNEKLKTHKINLLDVINHEEGYRDSLFSRQADSGKTINQTKIPVFY